MGFTTCRNIGECVKDSFCKEGHPNKIGLGSRDVGRLKGRDGDVVVCLLVVRLGLD